MGARDMKHALLTAMLASLMVVLDCGTSVAEPRTGTFWPVINIKATSPQLISLELGMSYEFRESQSSDTGIGPFISYEPGIYGQKAHLGVVYTHITGLLEAIYVAKLSASYFQAWDDTSGLSSGDTMYGVELTGTYGIFLLSGGVYYNHEKHDYLGTIGAGIGW
jgi:hypothetical protein